MLVEIYGKTGCTFCEKAKFVCQMKSIKFHYYQLGLNYDLEELNARVGQPVRTMPQIFVDDKHVGGYEQFNMYLNQKQK